MNCKYSFPERTIISAIGMVLYPPTPGRPQTNKAVIIASKEDQSVLSSPKVLVLLYYQGGNITKNCLATLANIPVKERPELIFCVSGAYRQIRFLWGVKKLARSFSNPASWEGQVVAFSRDVVEGMLPPMVLVEKTWWELLNKQVSSQAKTLTDLLGLPTTATEVVDTIPEEDSKRLPLDLLVPLTLVASLLNPPILSPPNTYALIKSI